MTDRDAFRTNPTENIKGCGVHFEDQLGGEKKCGYLCGKVALAD